MSEQNERHPMTTKRVLYEIAGMNDVRVRRDVEYEPSRAGSLTMDVYCPPAEATAPLPAIVIVSGYPDEGFRRILGCLPKRRTLVLGLAGSRVCKFMGRDVGEGAAGGGHLFVRGDRF